MRIYLNVLGTRQLDALRRLGPVASELGFYLGGGTAIALQLGHRRSIDLDWFTVQRRLDPLLVAEHLRNRGLSFVTDDTAPATLHGRLFNVRVTFLAYPYPNLKPTRISSDLNCSLASLDDLAAMKLAALSQRGAKRDFIDLYALCRKHGGLSALLRSYQRRFRTTNTGHLLYSLSYFKDADRHRTPAMLWKVDWPTMKKHIQASIQELSR